MRKLTHSQNFIKDQNLVKKLLELPQVDLRSDDLLLEIGPGSGIITELLLAKLEKAGKLIAVEIDTVLYKKLRNRLGKDQKFELHNKDFLKFTFPTNPFKVFSNIPFNFTSDILGKLLDPANQMTHSYLIIQKEAFLNYAGSQAGNHNSETLKSLITYPFYELKDIYQFSQSDFTPEPSVSIVLGSFVKRDEPFVKIQNLKRFLDFIAAVTKDRAGEGVWKEIFTKTQLNYMSKNFGLQLNKGISMQTSEVILSVFDSFLDLVEEKKKRRIEGSWLKLKEQESKLNKTHRTTILES